MATIVVLALHFLSVNRRPSLPHPFNALPQPTKDLTTDANAARAQKKKTRDAAGGRGILLRETAYEVQPAPVTMPDHRPPGTPSRSVFARPLGGRSFSPVLALLLKPLRLRMRSRASTPVILIFEISTLHRSSAEDEKNNTRFQHSRRTIAGLVFCSCEQESGANLVRKRQRKAAAGRGESARSSEKARALGTRPEHQDTSTPTASDLDLLVCPWLPRQQSFRPFRRERFRSRRGVQVPPEGSRKAPLRCRVRVGLPSPHELALEAR